MTNVPLSAFLYPGDEVDPFGVLASTAAAPQAHMSDVVSIPLPGIQGIKCDEVLLVGDALASPVIVTRCGSDLACTRCFTRKGCRHVSRVRDYLGLQDVGDAGTDEEVTDGELMHMECVPSN